MKLSVRIVNYAYGMRMDILSNFRDNKMTTKNLIVHILWII